MKKICYLLCILIVISFVGCSKAPDTTSDVPIIVLPDNETRLSLNGYRDPLKPLYDPDSADKEQNLNPHLNRDNASYFANKTTKKYHIFDCIYAVNMTDEKIVFFATYSDAEKEGYIPCKKCLSKD